MSEKTQDVESDLDAIMAERESGQTTTPEIETKEPPASEAQADDTAEDGPNRDESGRFKSKGEGKAEDTSQEAAAEAGEPGEEPGTVPQQALHESRRKEQEARSKAEELERIVQQMQGQLSTVTQMLGQQPAQPQAEPEPTPDFWENPDQFVQHNLKGALNPVQREIQSMREEFSRGRAIDKFGEQTVNEAYQALDAAIRSGDRDALQTKERVLSSQHPYGDMVSWHQEQQWRQRVGNDFEGYEERLKKEAVAEYLASQGQGQQTQRQPAPSPNRGNGQQVMPSNLSTASGGGGGGPKLIDPGAPLSEIMAGAAGRR